MEMNPSYIKQQRIALGLKQNQLAKKVGVSNVAVCDWEKGNRRPSPQSKIKLCEIFYNKLDVKNDCTKANIWMKNGDIFSIETTGDPNVPIEVKYNNKSIALLAHDGSVFTKIIKDLEGNWKEYK